MFSNKIKINYIIYFIFTILIFIILYAVFFMSDKIDSQSKSRNINKDGCSVIKSMIEYDSIEILHRNCKIGNYKYVKYYIMNNTNVLNNIKQLLGNDYIFQDYIWVIQKSKVHTCHRDNNGDFFNEGQKYPEYTIIFYLESMKKCLGVIPKSHMNKNSYNTNLGNALVNLQCNKGDAILFNTNLIHVGTFNKKNDYLRIQMKLAHKDDIQTLSYYQNYNKVLKINNTIPRQLLRFQKNLSCMFPIVSNWTQSENIKSSRGTDNGAKISVFQKIFSFLFYGNANYYDLPNV